MMDRILLALSLILIPSQAFAWNQTYECNDAICQGYCYTAECQEACMPQKCKDGYYISWKKPCVQFHLNMAGTRQMPYEFVEQATINAIAEWYRPEVSSLTPHYSGRTSDDTIGYKIGYTNSNVIVFRDDGWDESPEMMALTTVMHNASTGHIVDADIEINTTLFKFGVYEVDGMSVNDYQNTLTHEIGHVFGLAHSNVPGSTMTDRSSNGDITLRTLDEDDLNAISAVYPPKKLTCEFKDGFFVPEVANSSSDCAANGLKSPSRPTFPLILLGALLFIARSRRPY